MTTIRQINEALRRVVVPAEHREIFTAGVRALAYELEKDAAPAYEESIMDDISRAVGADVSGKKCTTAYAEYLRKTTAPLTDTQLGKPPAVKYECEKRPKTAADIQEPRMGFDSNGNLVHVVPDNDNDIIPAAIQNHMDAFMAEFLPSYAVSVGQFKMTDSTCNVVFTDDEERDGKATFRTAHYLSWVRSVTEQTPEQTFQDQLTTFINKAFDNEEAFIAKFLPGTAVSVDAFYMAGERCLLVYSGCVPTTIKTADFLEWVATI